MTGLSQPDREPDLAEQARRQRAALEEIAAICAAVNYPPDLVVDIDALARRGLGETPRSFEAEASQGRQA